MNKHLYSSTKSPGTFTSPVFVNKTQHSITNTPHMNLSSSYNSRLPFKQSYLSPNTTQTSYANSKRLYRNANNNYTLHTSPSNNSYKNNNTDCNASPYLFSIENDKSNNNMYQSYNQSKQQQQQQPKYESRNIGISLTTSTPLLSAFTNNPNEINIYNTKLKNELAVSTQKNTELISINETLHKQTQNAINYNASLKEELKQLENEIKNEITANNNLQSKYNDILKQYTSDYQNKQKSIYELQTQNEIATAQNEQLQKENERLSNDILNYEHLIAELKQTIEELSNTNINDKYDSDINVFIQDKEREINEKEEYIQKLKEKNEKLKKDNLNKQNQLTQLKELLQQKEKEMPNTSEMQKELDNYEMKIKMLYTMVDQKDLNIKSVQQSYDSMYSSLHKTEKENEDYEMKYLQEKEKNDMLEKKINELNALARGVIESREDIMGNYERQLNKLNKEHHNKIKEKEMKSNDNTTI